MKVTEGLAKDKWLRCIKKTGEYVDIPIPRGCGGHARQVLFDSAWIWTYNCFIGGDKDQYDYWCLIDTHGNEKPFYFLLECSKNYLKTLESKDCLQKIGRKYYSHCVLEVDENNQIIVPEEIQKRLKDVGYDSIYDYITHKTMFGN